MLVWKLVLIAGRDGLDAVRRGQQVSLPCCSNSGARLISSLLVKSEFVSWCVACGMLTVGQQKLRWQVDLVIGGKTVASACRKGFFISLWFEWQQVSCTVRKHEPAQLTGRTLWYELSSVAVVVLLTSTRLVCSRSAWECWRILNAAAIISIYCGP